MNFEDTLEFVRDARKRGLKTPVILMGELGDFRIMVVPNSCTHALIPLGYYNPILSYGEDRAVKESVEAGANGFIMVDLPPEEAIRFREICRSNS